MALPAVRGRHPAMSFGPVEPTRRGFRVETTNAEGTVLFRAIIEPDGTLTVASRSRINGGSLVLRYRFVPFPPEP